MPSAIASRLRSPAQLQSAAYLEGRARLTGEYVGASPGGLHQLQQSSCVRLVLGSHDQLRRGAASSSATPPWKSSRPASITTRCSQICWISASR